MKLVKIIQCNTFRNIHFARYTLRIHKIYSTITRKCFCINNFPLFNQDATFKRFHLQ